MNEDPANEISKNESPCCCHGHPSKNRVLVAALLICGIGGVAAGTATLLWMTNAEIGIGPFTPLENDDLGGIFLLLRRMAFTTIAFGITAFLMGLYLRSRGRRIKCAE